MLFQQAKALNPALTLDPEPWARGLGVKFLMDTAQKLAQTDDLSRAIERLTEAKAIDLTLSFEPEEQAKTWRVQYLMETAEELARSNQIPKAIAHLTESKTLAPKLDIAPEDQAKTWRVQYLMDTAKELARDGDLSTASQRLAEAQELDATLEFDPQVRAEELAVEPYLREGERLAEEGNVNGAIRAYQQAEARGLEGYVTAQDWNKICRVGSTFAQAEQAMIACQKVVALAPEDGSMIDSRGLARAMSGDLTGAIVDFRSFIQLTSDADAIAQRQAWIATLERRENPFTPEVLQSLQ